MTLPGKTRKDQKRKRQGRAIKTTLPRCCEELKGWALAWHIYSAHGGPYPRKSEKERKR